MIFGSLSMMKRPSRKQKHQNLSYQCHNNDGYDACGDADGSDGCDGCSGSYCKGFNGVGDSVEEEQTEEKERRMCEREEGRGEEPFN